MSDLEFIPVDDLCHHYDVELSFFTRLSDFGLIEVITVEQVRCIPAERVGQFEKILRLQNELDLNLEGIDVVLNLLGRIDRMEQQMNSMRGKLRLFEDLP